MLYANQLTTTAFLSLSALNLFVHMAGEAQVHLWIMNNNDDFFSP